MKYILSLAFVLFAETSVHALSFPISSAGCLEINSKDAVYDGEAIKLSGDVAIEHPIGAVSCREARFIPCEGCSKEVLRKALIELEGDVVVTMNGGGVLSCDSALLDYKGAVAEFYSSEKGFVVYEEYDDKQFPLTLKSREMMVKIGEGSGAGIREVKARGDVHINYYRQVVALGEEAVYFSSGKGTPQLSGEVQLIPSDSNQYCQVFLQGGETIKSKGIVIDTAKKHVSFISPQGKFLERAADDASGIIVFQSDTMILDVPADKATLLGDIHISEEGVAELDVRGEVSLTKEEYKGKKTVRYVSIIGKMTFKRFDEDFGLCYTLKNDGSAIIDNRMLTGVLESASSHDPEAQVHFHDQLGEAFCDKLIVHYSPKKNTFDAQRLFLEGNVKLKNSVGHSILQFMIADNIEYTPSERMLSMKGVDNRRVLFYDKINNMQISAPGLKVSRDKISKKDNIQGFGDVRFRFLEQELEQLKKRFIPSHGEELDESR